MKFLIIAFIINGICLAQHPPDSGKMPSKDEPTENKPDESSKPDDSNTPDDSSILDDSSKPDESKPDDNSKPDESNQTEDNQPEDNSAPLDTPDPSEESTKSMPKNIKLTLSLPKPPEGEFIAEINPPDILSSFFPSVKLTYKSQPDVPPVSAIPVEQQENDENNEPESEEPAPDTPEQPDPENPENPNEPNSQSPELPPINLNIEIKAPTGPTIGGDNRGKGLLSTVAEELLINIPRAKINATRNILNAAI